MYLETSIFFPLLSKCTKLLMLKYEKTQYSPINFKCTLLFTFALKFFNFFIQLAIKSMGAWCFHNDTLKWFNVLSFIYVEICILDEMLFGYNLPCFHPITLQYNNNTIIIFFVIIYNLCLDKIGILPYID